MTAYQGNLFRTLSSLGFSVYYLDSRIVFFNVEKSALFQNTTSLDILQQN